MNRIHISKSGAIVSMFCGGKTEPAGKEPEKVLGNAGAGLALSSVVIAVKLKLKNFGFPLFCNAR